MSLWRESPAFRVTVFILLGLVVLLFGPWLYLDWQMQRDLDLELKRIRDAGEPLTLADAAPEMPPPSENAAELYQQVMGRIAADGTMPGSDAFELTGYDNLIERDYLSDAVTHEDARPALEDPRIVQALETLRQGSQCEKCAFPVNWGAGPEIVFPHYAKMRKAARWMSAKSKLCAHDGEIDEALEWARVSLRMSEHAAGDPVIIAQLVAIACQAIATAQAQETLKAGAPSPQMAREMIAYLRTVDAKGPFDRAFLGERAMGMDSSEMIKDEGLSIAELMGGEVPPGWSLLSSLYGSRFGRPFLNNDQIIYLRLMRSQIEIVNNAPPEEREKRASELETSVPSIAVLSKMMAPVFARSVDRRDQAIANLDLFEIALQAELYHAQRGEWPADLQALQDTIGYALPEDPFARAPYHYRRGTDGFAAWSLGTDLDDDGGHGLKDPGYEYENSDIVWKLAR